MSNEQASVPGNLFTRLSILVALMAGVVTLLIYFTGVSSLPDLIRKYSSTTAASTDSRTCMKVAQTTDGFLSVRTGPGTDFAVSTRLNPGSQVSVDACVAPACTSRSWRHIVAGDGAEGWVNQRYLQSC